MFAPSSLPDYRDDTCRNYHRCFVRAFSWANKPSALGVVYRDRNRLWREVPVDCHLDMLAIPSPAFDSKDVQ
jgi:hypothetical protein